VSLLTTSTGIWLRTGYEHSITDPQLAAMSRNTNLTFSPEQVGLTSVNF